MAKEPVTLEKLTAEQLNDMKAAMKAFNATMKRDGYGRAHAKAGGEMGVNGEWYEGGKFLPDHELTLPTFRMSSPKFALVAPATKGQSAKGYQPIWDKIRNYARCPYDVDEKTGEIKIDRSLGAMTYTEKNLAYDAGNQVACNSGLPPSVLLGDDEEKRERWFERSGNECFPKKVYSAEDKARMIEFCRQEFEKEMRLQRARLDVQTHLLAMWKQGMDYVSDLYMIAVQKASLEKNGIPPPKKTCYCFQFINSSGQAKRTEGDTIDSDKFNPDALVASFQRSHERAANVRIGVMGEIYRCDYREIPAPIWEALPNITLLGDDTDYEAVKEKEIAKRKALDGGAMEKGKFSSLHVICTGARKADGYYGTVWKYKFKTDEGKLLHWSSSNDQGIGIGDTMDLSGTCKGSNEFQGETYNFVSRCTAANFKKAEEQKVKRTDENTADLA